jgi:uncharacterized protein YggE
MKLDKSVQITLIVCVTVLVLGLFAWNFFDGLVPNYKDVVSTQGNSVIEVEPNIISVYFTVETWGETAQDAKDNNSLIVDELISNLIVKGFNREDITTESFSVFQDYTWTNNGREDNGFKATHYLKVSLEKEGYNSVGEVIDAGVDAGALVSYVGFELSQELQSQTKAEALKLATEDARMKAEAIAEGLGMTLGSLQSVSTSDFYYQPWEVYSDRMGYSTEEIKAEVSTNVQPGDRSVRASVSVSYRLR